MKEYLFILFALIFISCKDAKPSCVLHNNDFPDSAYFELVLYTDVLKLQKQVDPFIQANAVAFLRNELIKTGMAENAVVTGNPMYMSVPNIEIDSDAAVNYTVSYYYLTKELSLVHWDTIRMGNANKKWNSNEEKFLRQRVSSLSGDSVFLRSIARMSMIKTNCDTAIFLPAPATYIYKEKEAVRLKIFCRPAHKGNLKRFIDNNLQEILNKKVSIIDGRNAYFQYEII